MRRKQSGFAIIEILLTLVALVVIGAIVYFALSNKPTDTKPSSTNTREASYGDAQIKHLGVSIETYDPATNRAGDFMFTKQHFSFGVQMIFWNYGFEIPASPDYPAKRNPQPTLILPLGTKVHSLVDGEVYNVPQLYSGDYSVMVRPQGSDLIFEMEHVINVTVKKGDKVKAGDIVAEVSDYDSRNYGGNLGLFEVGVLKGGSPPSHVCPSDYFHPSVKDELLAKITSLQKSWEEYRGDSTIYDESKVVVPGCESRNPVEG